MRVSSFEKNDSEKFMKIVTPYQKLRSGSQWTIVSFNHAFKILAFFGHILDFTEVRDELFFKWEDIHGTSD